jgi:hypothetical protein
MWDLIFLVFMVFFVMPVTWAVIDEYRWHRAGQHRERVSDQILTGRRERR